MAEATTLSVRTDKTLKEEVGKILRQLGLNHSTAINMYYRQILTKNLSIAAAIQLHDKTPMHTIFPGESELLDPMA